MIETLAAQLSAKHMEANENSARTSMNQVTSMESDNTVCYWETLANAIYDNLPFYAIKAVNLQRNCNDGDPGCSVWSHSLHKIVITILDTDPVTHILQITPKVNLWTKQSWKYSR